jgi:hypothetical protein
MGDTQINYIGLVSGKNYGPVNPKTTFFILFEDTQHEDFDMEVVQ